MPIGALTAAFFVGGALVTLPLPEALALVATFVAVEIALELIRAFFVAEPVVAAAFRFEARGEGSGVLALKAEVVVVGEVLDEETSGMVAAADLEEEASAGGGTAALEELAEVACRVVGFRAFFAAIAAFVASEEGAAVLA